MSTEIILFISIVASIIVTKLLVGLLTRLSFGQPIREAGNKSHYAKAGTPTMGGIGFIILFVLLTLIFAGFNFNTIMILIATVSYGAIGFIDDYEKVKKKNNLGLTEKQKLLLQIGVALVLVVVCYVLKEDFTYLIIPFTKANVNFGIFIIPILVFALVGATNAVNLTDGIDGLLASVSIPVFLGIYFISLKYSTDISIPAIIFSGLLIGYLAFNSNPASLFMGDTGSMAIGGAITMMMVLMNLTLFLIILGGIYVAETLSVIIQVASFKSTGKRVFLMSPIHHHFELKGHKEPKIVANFMIVSILLTIVTYYLVK